MNAETSKNLHSLNSKKDSENSGSTSQHNNSMEVNRRKRKLCMSSEPPRKRQRCMSKITEVVGEAEMPRGTKRKACSPSESPKEKRRKYSNTTDDSDATEVLVKVAPARGTKRRARSPSESPKKKRRKCSNDVEICKPSTSMVSDKEAECERDLSAEQLSGSRTPMMSCWSDSSSLSSSISSNSTKGMFYTAETSEAFEERYTQLYKLGEGGFGSVYAGFRKTDLLPVAIKHILKADVKTQPEELNGEMHLVPTEVILMIRAAGGTETVGESAAIILLDWFDMEHEVILVMERPDPCMSLYDYLCLVADPMEEVLAKSIMKQLVEAAIKMHSQGVFHRDIKLENILIETGSDVPRVRVIDFGCGCLLENSPYSVFSGTAEYAPPEYFLERRYEAGPTTVWQLGALLYELLKGNRQFTTSSFLCTGRTFFQDLRGLNVSDDCCTFFEMCVAEDPRERATLEQMQQHPWFE